MSADEREALAREIFAAPSLIAWQWGDVYKIADHLLAAGFRRHPEGTTVTEWRLRCNHGVSGEHEQRWHLPDPGPSCTDAVVERHERTFYADLVTEWVPVDD